MVVLGELRPHVIFAHHSDGVYGEGKQGHTEEHDADEG